MRQECQECVIFDIMRWETFCTHAEKSCYNGGLGETWSKHGIPTRQSACETMRSARLAVTLYFSGIS